MNERLRSAALASRSPRRKQLLESLGLDVVIVPSTYDEQHLRERSPRRLVVEHALGKAAAAHAHGPRVLVAADTLVDVDGISLGKPRDQKEAAVMLRMLSGRRHLVHTGFVVVDRVTQRRVSGVESSAVSFLPLENDVIARYVETGEPLDKAGAYGIQGFGALLVESIAGDFYTVMGLPLARVGQACVALGFDLL